MRFISASISATLSESALMWSNEKEISHSRVSWQTLWAHLRRGAVCFIDWLDAILEANWALRARCWRRPRPRNRCRSGCRCWLVSERAHEFVYAASIYTRKSPLGDVHSIFALY